MARSAIEDQRALVLQAADTNTREVTKRTVPPFYEFVWSFVLEAVEPGNTHLIIRERYAYDWRPKLTTTIRVIFIVSFLMTRKMMLGLKSRSERT
ncbi:MAG: hypothetical protein FJX78_09960 [Armatimonadetes bacterium]|nr:hypothetical protein [Armatimonadota bacterium]